MTPFSLRLNERAKSELEAMARATRRSRAFLVNEAIHSYAERYAQKSTAGVGNEASGFADSQSPLLEPGLKAHPQQPPKYKPVDIGKYVGSMRGTFGSVDDIDAYLAGERASWRS